MNSHTSAELLLGSIILLLLFVVAIAAWLLFLSVRRGVVFQRDIARLEGERRQLVARIEELQTLVPPDNRRGRRRAKSILQKDRAYRRPPLDEPG